MPIYVVIFGGVAVYYLVHAGNKRRATRLVNSTVHTFPGNVYIIVFCYYLFSYLIRFESRSLSLLVYQANHYSTVILGMNDRDAKSAEEENLRKCWNLQSRGEAPVFLLPWKQKMKYYFSN